MADWYRNTSWSPEIAETFHANLGRARSQRDQYIVIQALTLAHTEPEVAIELTDLYLKTRSSDDDLGRCKLARSAALLQVGRHDEVIETYREMLDVGDAQPFMITGSVIEYAWLVAKFRSIHNYPDAWSRISDLAIGNISVPLTVFKYHAARAVMLDHRGSNDAAAVDAATALQAAEVTEPDEFLGTAPLVGPEEGELVWRLRQIIRR